MILADTNVLSTFAKINQLLLLIQYFASDQIGTVPAVYEEVQRGVQKGYSPLQAVVDLVQQQQIELIVPTEQELFKKAALAASFGAGEREIMAVAMTRNYAILTDETRVINWCRRTGTSCWDLPVKFEPPPAQPMTVSGYSPTISICCSDLCRPTRQPPRPLRRWPCRASRANRGLRRGCCGRNGSCFWGCGTP